MNKTTKQISADQLHVSEGEEGKIRAEKAREKLPVTVNATKARLKKSERSHNYMKPNFLRLCVVSVQSLSLY